MLGDMDAVPGWQELGVHWHAHHDNDGGLRERGERSLVAPSAVLGTPEEVADWLREHYQREVRPCPAALIDGDITVLGSDTDAQMHWSQDRDTAGRGDSICRIFPHASGDGVGVLYIDAYVSGACRLCFAAL